ncbi:MAG: single-stranded DNA-binding protein [Actinobacteria bacterium]|nr:single-stranded DNA-binding protein [Actinomycetota bacterium]
MTIARSLSAEVGSLRFAPPVSHVYNPLEYAWQPHSAYLRRCGSSLGGIVLLGMNPGPWGMAQTGVPFGEVEMVRDWLGIYKPVERPVPEHPQRPVTGLDCPRHEVSGRRLWGWARDRFKTPDVFFREFFVANYCPLAFLEETGRNRTPDKLPASERTALFEACDRALRATVDTLKPSLVIGVGTFAEARAVAALAGSDIVVARIAHPSPANPAANRGWEALVDRQLAELGVDVPPPSGGGPRES